MDQQPVSVKEEPIEDLPTHSAAFQLSCARKKRCRNRSSIMDQQPVSVKEEPIEDLPTHSAAFQLSCASELVKVKEEEEMKEVFVKSEPVMDSDYYISAAATTTTAAASSIQQRTMRNVVTTSSPLMQRLDLQDSHTSNTSLSCNTCKKAPQATPATERNKVLDTIEMDGPPSKRVRTSSPSTCLVCDPEKCIICQKIDPQCNTTSSENGRKRLKEAAGIRKDIVYERLHDGEEAVLPSTNQPSTSQPSVRMTAADASVTDSQQPPLLVLGTAGEDWDMPPPLKTQREGACVQQAEEEEEDEAALQRKKLKLQSEVLQVKKELYLEMLRKVMKN